MDSKNNNLPNSGGGALHCVRLEFAPGQVRQPGESIIAFAAEIAQERYLRKDERARLQEMLDWVCANLRPDDRFVKAAQTENRQIWMKLYPGPHLLHLENTRSVLEGLGYRFDLFHASSCELGRVLFENDWGFITLPPATRNVDDYQLRRAAAPRVELTS